MSILAANEQAELGANLFVIVLAFGSLWLAYANDVFQRSTIIGPDRLDPDRPITPVVMLLIISIAVWQIIPIFYLLPIQQHVQKNPSREWSIDLLEPHHLAFLAVVPAMTALTVTLVSAAILQRDLLSRMGLTVWKVFRGIAGGLLGIFIIVPPLLVVSIVTEWVYQRVGYKHPAEHELLKVLGDRVDAGEQSVAILLIVSATVVAPLFEELLFRGLLQSILVAVGQKLLGRAPRLHEFDVVQAQQSFQPQTAIMEEIPLAREPRRREVVIRWSAIIGTSLLFMVVHPTWSWPPIFFLSIGLGYAYERTGNLWVPIAIHLLFNSLSTIMYLNFAPDKLPTALFTPV